MKEIVVKNESEKVKTVKKIILSAGNYLASVHFKKRSDGAKRRMSFRLHVRKPTYARAPGNKDQKRSKINRDNKQLTVFDVNKVRYNRRGLMCGRGDFRTIPLETVTRICVNGEIYKIIS
ncbi:MAG: hypothetical protein PHW73_11945 [Atribacterota bacterium]|nr:hypothetical protein [Atribacterota bacterium]